MNARAHIAVLAVVVVAALFFVFRPDDDDNDEVETVVAPTTVTAIETEPTTTQATTTTGPPTGPWRIDTRDDRIDRLRVAQGAVLELTVEADVTDHVHVHGYDLMRDVAPGTPARLRFEANLTGRFDVELEDAGQEIAQLTVVP